MDQEQTTVELLAKHGIERLHSARSPIGEEQMKVDGELNLLMHKKIALEAHT